MVKRLGGGWCTQGAHRAALILGQIRVYPERDWLRRQSASHLIGQNHNLSLGHDLLPSSPANVKSVIVHQPGE